MNKDEIVSFLTKKFPKSKIKFIDSGSDSDAFRVDSRVIRIPHANTQHLYVRESEICAAIASEIHFDIPQITVHTEKNGMMWAEHEMIMGKFWSWHKFMWQPRHTRNLGRSLARFMMELHSVDTRKIPLKYRKPVPYMPFDDVAPYIARFLSNRQMHFFEQNYERILSYPIKKSDMVLVHLGIKGPNSVVDNDANLTGVFDFCNAGIYERERDMVLIAMMAPCSLWRTFAREYRRLTNIKPNKKRIMDLAVIEFLWAKRWHDADGNICPLNDRFLLKNIASAMAHFHHLPRLCQWLWYYAIKLRRNI